MGFILFILRITDASAVKFLSVDGGRNPRPGAMGRMLMSDHVDVVHPVNGIESLGILEISAGLLARFPT